MSIYLQNKIEALEATVADLRTRIERLEAPVAQGSPVPVAGQLRTDHSVNSATLGLKRRG